MPTIIIKKGIQLSESVFETYEDFINAYYHSTGKVVLQNIDLYDLSESEHRAYKKHLRETNNVFEDFRG